MKKSNLNIKLGKDSEGNYFSYDIQKMGHLLIGGVSGEHNINFIHSIVKQLIENNSNDEVKFIMSDICNFDRTHLDVYSKINYMLAPVITEPQKVTEMFNWLDSEQGRRYELLRKTNLRTTDDYNEKFRGNVLPKIIVIINDLAGLMDEIPKFEKTLIKIMQLSKYSGINIILLSQSCDKEVLTGVIKATISSRIAFKTEDQIASFLLVGQSGAEKLEDNGELLFISPENLRPIKLKNDFVFGEESYNLINIEHSTRNPKYNKRLLFSLKLFEDGFSDVISSKEMLNDAIKCIAETDEQSIRNLQNNLCIGYARARGIIELLIEYEVIPKVDPITKRRKLL
jgi:S-DNA-T family DNA segregation ATPase FtsK/SpoIIIE